MKLLPNFYNDFSRDYRTMYFPNENHAITENANYWKAKHIVESFNNGCISFWDMCVELAKCCETYSKTIESLASKYIIK